MSIKRFCDCCGEETAFNYIEKGLSGTAFVNGKRKLSLKIEIEFVSGGDGDICARCLSEALYQIAPATILTRQDEEAEPRRPRTRAAA